MSKGSTPAGTATTTTSNKLSDTLLPYMTTGLDNAKAAFQNLDSQTGIDNTKTGYSDLFNTATSDTTKNTGTNATTSLDNLLTGNTTSQKGQTNSANSLYSLASADIPAYDTGTGELSKTASGYYLNSNPYLDKMYNSAAKGVTDYYQTATAPSTDSTAESSGRYGSGWLNNARSQNELDLGYSLDKLAADIYGKNYSTERGYQNTAANNLATQGLNKTKLSGSLLDAAGTQYGNLTTGSENALQLYPTVQKQTFYPAQQEVTAGEGQIKTPYMNAAAYLGLIPTATGSSTSETKPYFTNSTTDTLGTALGGTSLYNNLFGSSSSSGSTLASGLYNNAGTGLLNGYGLGAGKGGTAGTAANDLIMAAAL